MSTIIFVSILREFDTHHEIVQNSLGNRKMTWKLLLHNSSWFWGIFLFFSLTFADLPFGFAVCTSYDEIAAPRVCTVLGDTTQLETCAQKPISCEQTFKREREITEEKKNLQKQNQWALLVILWHTHICASSHIYIINENFYSVISLEFFHRPNETGLNLLLFLVYRFQSLHTDRHVLISFVNWRYHRAKCPKKLHFYSVFHKRLECTKQMTHLYWTKLFVENVCYWH